MHIRLIFPLALIGLGVVALNKWAGAVYLVALLLIVYMVKVRGGSE